VKRSSDPLITKQISTSDFAGQQHEWCRNMSCLIQEVSGKYYDLLNTNMAFERSRATAVIQICVCYSADPAKHSRDTSVCLLQCPPCTAFTWHIFAFVTISTLHSIHVAYFCVCYNVHPAQHSRGIFLRLLQCPPCTAFTWHIFAFVTVSTLHSIHVAYFCVCYNVHPAQHSRGIFLCLLQCPPCTAFT